MEIQDAFVSINNLDLKKSARRFGPTWSYIIVNQKLEVVAVEKYKKDLSDIEEKSMAGKYKDCVLIIARPGDYNSVDEFEEQVKSCKDTFEYIRENP